MEEYTYRLLTIEDLKELNNLFQVAFNRNPKRDFVRWKYFKNPAGDAVLVGAFYKDKLVGSGAMLPEKMNVFNQKVTIFKCTDLMTHPEHQRKGLSKKINEALVLQMSEMNTPFLYTMCSKISTKSFLRNNWIFLEQVINFFKPYEMLIIQNFFRKDNFQTFGFYDGVKSHLNEYEFQIDSSRISAGKSSDYLKWRTSNPYFKYKIICSYDNAKKIDGYLIYSISENNLLNVIDIDSLDKNEEVIHRLLLCAEYIALKEKYKGIVIMAVKNTLFYNFVQSRNYLRNPFEKGPLTAMLDFDVYLFDKSIADITDLSLWKISALNYDDI